MLEVEIKVIREDWQDQKFRVAQRLGVFQNTLVINCLFQVPTKDRGPGRTNPLKLCIARLGTFLTRRLNAILRAYLSNHTIFKVLTTGTINVAEDSQAS